MALYRKASFRLGEKEVYLPNFTIALLRNDYMSPFQARFKVPLWFSKLDIRDYLWHVYGVEISAVRSYVKLSPVQQGDGRSQRPQNQIKRWYRPRSHKYMTVEMTEPFVWPEDNSGEKDFGKETLALQQDDYKEAQRMSTATADAEAPAKSHIEKMREQAEALLKGKSKWAPPRDTEKLSPFSFKKS